MGARGVEHRTESKLPEPREALTVRAVASAPPNGISWQVRSDPPSSAVPVTFTRVSPSVGPQLGLIELIAPTPTISYSSPVRVNC